MCQLGPINYPLKRKKIGSQIKIHNKLLVYVLKVDLLLIIATIFFSQLDNFDYTNFKIVFRNFKSKKSITTFFNKCKIYT